MSVLKRHESSFGPLFDVPGVRDNRTNPLNGAQSSGRAPTVVDVFCGSGGLTLGLVQAGFDCVGAFDHWGPAVKTFGLNICDNVKDLDLTETPNIPDCDVIAGGPPCQGFSSAGRRQGSDPRNSLVEVFADIVTSRRPKAFVFENVEGFLTAGGGKFVRDLLAPLVSAGYCIHLRKVNAANFGVPQHRKRVIAIGGLGFDPGFPASTHRAFGAPGAHLLDNLCREARTLDEAISGLPPATIEPPGLVDGHWFRPYNRVNSERAAFLGPGERMRDLPDYLWHSSYLRRAMRRVMDGTPVEKRGGPPAGLRRLRGDEPCKAITGGTLRDFVHPHEDRPLTIREAARVQTYPDWFVFEGSYSDKMKMIGNSVPVHLAAKIGCSLFQNLTDGQIKYLGKGQLISFVPTLSTGMSPALAQTCHIVKSEFGGTGDYAKNSDP